jgi:hypothetical protein
LHPLQDYYAHGDFGFTETGSGDIWVWHNQKAPPYSLPAGYTDPVSLVDDPDFDTFSSTDGRPVSGSEQGTGTTAAGHSYEWFVFELGNKRIRATEASTRSVLAEYLAHLRYWATDCCKCRTYFGY